MSLIVEDGTGVAGAESYASVTAADTYWTNRPTSSLSATWLAATTGNKESALRVATMYLDTKYRWKGLPAEDDQSLAWPRVDVYTERGAEILSEVPTNVVNATIEMAARALSEDLFPDVDKSNYTTKEQVGPITVEYAGSAPSSKLYGYVTLLLRGLASSGSTLDIVRA